MKSILVILNYYYPYISGLSEYARIIAEEMVRRGYSVSVVTSNHNNCLPAEETLNGVRVIRAPILLKISKGAISTKYITLARRLSKQADVVNLHLPMLEAGLLSWLIAPQKTAVTFQCDINLPQKGINPLIQKVMDLSARICLRRCASIMVTSADYAKSSRVASQFPEKYHEMGAPIKKYLPDKHALAKKPHAVKRIGFCGRIVEEKGVDVLIRAYSLLRKTRTDIELVIGGMYESVAGGSVYPELQKYIQENKVPDVHFLGAIPEDDMAAFYTSLDVFTLPSINSLEAFGMVQLEAMRCGTPVVSSDLPGVKTIVERTGMGLVSRRGDAASLSECLKKILDRPEQYFRNLSYIESLYGLELTADGYEKCFLAIAPNT